MWVLVLLKDDNGKNQEIEREDENKGRVWYAILENLRNWVFLLGQYVIQRFKNKQEIASFQ